MKFLPAVLLAICLTTTSAISEDSEWLLREPKVHRTTRHKLKFTLTLEVANVTIGPGKWMQTRTFGGSVPGPTVKIKPGQRLMGVMYNKLVGGTEHVDNEFSAPNETNLHLHGLHIDGDWPSDSVTRVIYPIGYKQENILTPNKAFYYTDISSKHLPGTHWMHTHRHGSTTLQVAGGAAAAIIVEEYVPIYRRGRFSRFFRGRRKGWRKLPIADGVDGAPEIVLVFQPIWDMETIVNDYANDPVFKTNVEGDFTLVNGRINPVIKVKQYVWTRMRLINTAYTNVIRFNFYIDGCELALLSKDGVYVQDFPRKIRSAWPPPGGRADVMVRCNSVGRFAMYGYNDSAADATLDIKAATVLVTRGRRSSAVALGPLKFTVDGYDAYLDKTIDAYVEDKCKCKTEFVVDVATGAPRFVVNDHTYKGDERIHLSVRGKVQQRWLNATVQGGHPYHQHVIPYQINTIDEVFDLSKQFLNAGPEYDDYLKVGDWHDTFAFTGILRFNPAEHEGKMILHCHKLDHEDEGMMSTEEILPPGNECKCGWSSGYPTLAPPVIKHMSIFHISGIAAAVVLALYLCYTYFTKRSKKYIVPVIEEDISLVEKKSGKDATATEDEAAHLIDQNNITV